MPEGQRLFARSPLALRQQGAGLLAGAGIHVVVAEENLRRCCVGVAVLGHVVGADVHGSGGGFFHELDGGCGSVGTAHTVGLAFGGLDDQEDAVVVYVVTEKCTRFSWYSFQLQFTAQQLLGEPVGPVGHRHQGRW